MLLHLKQSRRPSRTIRCFLQALGWAFFGISIILSAAPWVLAVVYPKLVVQGLTVCAGAAAIVSETLMVCSLLTFNRKEKFDLSRGMLPAVPFQEEPWTTKEKTALRHFLQSAAGRRWWSSFIGLQVILAGVACGLAVISDVLTHNPLAYIAVIAATIVCMTLAVFLTHGIGGQWRFYKKRWNFYQPGVGGLYFVALQGLSWSFFGVAIIIFLAHLLHALCGFSPVTNEIASSVGEVGGSLIFDPPSLVSGGLSGLLAEVLLVMSLLVFNEPDQQAFTPEELQRKPYKELQALAKETGACRANVKAAEMARCLAAHYQALALVRDDETTTAIKGRFGKP